VQEASGDQPMPLRFTGDDFVVRRGINISHWLSQSGRRGAERAMFFSGKDMDFIASLGYDHVRIPIDEEQMWDEQGNKEKDAFALLHEGIGWARSHGLRTVVDLHILRSHHFNEGEKPLWNEPEAQERFFQCWRELSDELIQYPHALVAYEIMNEPVADDPEDWNDLAARCIAVIREREPQRYIVLGSNRWQSVHTFDDLKVPDEMLLRWYRDVRFCLEKNDVGWANWDYKGGFGIVDQQGKPYEDLIGALLED
jgi:endoglucanase